MKLVQKTWNRGE